MAVNLVLTLSFFSLLCSSPILAAEPTKASVFDRYQSMEVLVKTLFYIENMYVNPDQAKMDDLINNAIEGVVNKLDPHTVHLSKKAFAQLTADTKGQIGGVGIIVKVEKDKLIIVSPIEGRPAMKKGIKAGDEIIAINDILVSKLGPDAFDLMHGESGTTLKLSIRRKGVEKPLEFSMIREVIQLSSVNSVTLGEGIVYTKITNFQENTSEDLRKVLKDNAGKIKGLIIDLRNNPGGLLQEAVNVADLFLESGLIVSTVGRMRDRVEREFARKQDSYVDFPIITLINEGSASAAEIVAGALQDHRRSLIMGTPSFGKGSVQTLIALPDGSGLKLTIATYYTPNDRSIQAKGIQPDIIVLNKQTIVPVPEAKKEANLRGHLMSNDLSGLGKKGGLLSEMASWPAEMAEDYQVESAFTYLKGWSVFHGPSKMATDKTQEKKL